jgi:hypothetical protein
LLRSDTVPADFIDGTQGHIRQDSGRLWLSVPVELRRLHLAVGDAPGWEGRFSRGTKVRTLLDLRDLPEAIACEMLYAAWRLLDLGASVQVGDTSTLLSRPAPSSEGLRAAASVADGRARRTVGAGPAARLRCAPRQGP